MRHKENRRVNVRWLLVFYDTVIFSGVFLLSQLLPPHVHLHSASAYLWHILLSFLLVFGSRSVCGLYQQIWRYGGVMSYFRMFLSDTLSGTMYYLLQRYFLSESLSFTTCYCLIGMNLQITLGTRLLYRYTYKYCDDTTWYGRALYRLFRLLGARSYRSEDVDAKKIKVAILGAGRMGNSLAEELHASPLSPYEPVVFFDHDRDKSGRKIQGMKVIREASVNTAILRKYQIQEVIIAIRTLTPEEKHHLYKRYKELGCRVKVYDYPGMETIGKRSVREFDVDELLFRKPIDIPADNLKSYYRGKRIVVTGGGGAQARAAHGEELSRSREKQRVRHAEYR